MNEKVTSVGVVAQALNLTTRRVQQLVTEGVIPTRARGKYQLEEAVAGYVKYLQDKLNGGDDARCLSSERARLASAQRQHTELRVMQLRSELVPIGAALRVLEALAAAMKSRLTAMPYVLKQRHPDTSPAAVIELQGLIDDALRQVASAGLPKEYQVRNTGGGDDAAGPIP